MITDVAVRGMTCGHCVAAVSEELTALDGVTGVDIGLVPSGVSNVRITSDSPLADAEVRAAVQEAGYEVATGP